jgi:hypothetical protein
MERIQALFDRLFGRTSDKFGCKAEEWEELTGSENRAPDLFLISDPHLHRRLRVELNRCCQAGLGTRRNLRTTVLIPIRV